MDHARLADEELMGLVAEADPVAFDVLYDRHSTAAFSLAYRICGRRGAAEDALQDAFLAAWRGAGRYDPTRGSVRTWLLGIVHHRSIDIVRRSLVHETRRASDEGIEERFAARERTEEEAIRRGDAVHVREALETLPPDQLKVVELAYFGGFTHTEIAEMLGAPLGTVKGRMRLGLEKLRASLGDGAQEAWT
jgi:RNA polymerase sigma-70 factor, ECF subfamily